MDYLDPSPVQFLCFFIEPYFHKVEQALDFLVLISILEKRGKGYTFLNRSFPRIVRESQDVDGLTEQLKEELA